MVRALLPCRGRVFDQRQETSRPASQARSIQGLPSGEVANDQHGASHSRRRRPADSQGSEAWCTKPRFAASSHNTQPWKFKLGKRSIGIFPDLTRRCPVVDPDDHHLFVSLGCATENLVCGALANGLYAHVAGRADRVDVAFEDTLPVRSTLYDALPQRQCSRSTYDGQQISAADLELLERAAAGPGVHPVVLTDRSDLETVAECVAHGTAAQIHNTAFVKELGTWIRFNEAEAARTGDGLSTAATGAPSGPRWLRRLLLHGALTLRSENDKERAAPSQLGRGHHLLLGQERSGALDRGRPLRTSASRSRRPRSASAMRFMNQAVEIAPLRTQLATWLNAGDRRPDLVVRFGRGPEMPRSRRRPLEQVILLNRGASPLGLP